MMVALTNYHAIDSLKREKKGKQALKYWMLTKNCYKIGENTII